MVNFDGVLTTVSLTMVTLPQPYLSIRNGYKQVLPLLLSLLVFSTRPKIKQTKMSMLQQHVISSHHQHTVQSSHEFVKRLVNASRLLCIHTYTSYQWCKYTIAMQNCYKSLICGEDSFITILTSWLVVVFFTLPSLHQDVRIAWAWDGGLDYSSYNALERLYHEKIRYKHFPKS
jgi:hypothetical protein